MACFKERRSTMIYLYQLIIDLKTRTKIDSKDPCLAAFYDLKNAFDSINQDFFFLLSAQK